MIQSGLKSAKGLQGSIQSNEFKFSVDDEEVAQELNEISNTGVKLHWKRYRGTLPWRGHSQFVVDKVVSYKQEQPSAPKSEPDFFNEDELEEL